MAKRKNKKKIIDFLDFLLLGIIVVQLATGGAFSVGRLLVPLALGGFGLMVFKAFKQKEFRIVRVISIILSIFWVVTQLSDPTFGSF